MDGITMSTEFQIANYVSRTFRDASDFDALATLTNACYEHAQHQDIELADNLRAAYTNASGFDLLRDMQLVEDRVDGVNRVIAFCRTVARVEPNGLQKHVIVVRVHPQWRKRGIGAALLAWAEARAGEKQRERPAREDVAESWTIDADGPEFAARNGYREQRRSIEMKRDLSEQIPVPIYPLGFELRPVTPEQHRVIYDADIDAFRDHYGFCEPDASDFARWVSEPIFQPELWKVLWHVESASVAAMVLNFILPGLNEKFGIQRGYTEGISTGRQFRRLGLARNLIYESMHMFKAMGMTHTMLGADAENLSGAVRVYESCGYHITRTFQLFRKTLSA
jgi:mycothiol synthase